ncbi:hypothetical protein DPMN_055155 [Dreissena polymorpha]|uniref:Uncharacterized protein n=1 Tax=Dreissena polymorpha TaxID=45954 RepID=A0A9D4HS00_DREPO|nr:hypothetical protein DPMN_055155 [Dreissena polymorpha]
MRAPAKLPFPLNSHGRFDRSPVGGLTDEPVNPPFSIKWEFDGSLLPIYKELPWVFDGGDKTSINI